PEPAAEEVAHERGVLGLGVLLVRGGADDRREGGCRRGRAGRFQGGPPGAGRSGRGTEHRSRQPVGNQPTPVPDALSVKFGPVLHAPPGGAPLTTRPQDVPRQGSVRISAPVSVTTSVCSNCAVRLRSLVSTVQPSLHIAYSYVSSFRIL